MWGMPTSPDPITPPVARSPREPPQLVSLAVLPANGMTMLVCERSIYGLGPDGQQIALRGVGCTVVRLQADGAWRIAADAWCLTDEFPVDF
jgi:ketosteroid isomerase-like protein